MASKSKPTPYNYRWAQLSKALRRQYRKQGHVDCAICGREIDLDAPPNHRDSLTIDHRVPHSRGGEMYALDNLSPAHKGCNSRKLDTVEYKEVTVNSSRKW